MIKKIIISGMLCFFAANMNAQKALSVNLQGKEDTNVSPIVKEKVEEFATKINAIIQDEKALMEAELKTLTAQNLEKSESDKQKSLIADKYSEKIDAKITSLGFDLDTVIQKQVRYSLLSSDVSSEAEMKAQILKKFRATKNVNAYMNYGTMALTNNLVDNDLDKNKGFGSNLEFGLKFNYQFTRTSAWGITAGVGFSWRTLRLDNNMIFIKPTNDQVAIGNYSGNTDKSKLRTGYIMVPVGFQYNFSKIKSAGMDVNYRAFDDGFRIGANFYGGAKMSTNNIVSGNDVEFRNKENYNVNPFIYGAQVTFSYDNINLFVKKDFSNYFKNNTFNNDKALVIGLGFGF